MFNLELDLLKFPVESDYRDMLDRLIRDAAGMDAVSAKPAIYQFVRVYLREICYHGATSSTVIYCLSSERNDEFSSFDFS